MNKSDEEKVFLCVGGDARQMYTAYFLGEQGNLGNDNRKVYSVGAGGALNGVKNIDSLSGLHAKADVLVLPMMKTDGLEIECADKSIIPCKDTVASLKKNALVCGGRLSVKQIEYYSAIGFEVADYYNREELIIKNCIPTAEGALEVAMRETAETVFGTRVLVLGYGRVAKACASLFKAVGARTAVCARSLSQLAQAECSGHYAFSFGELYGHIPIFSVIVNTVPQLVLDSEMLEAVGKNTLIIDLASKPGGVDDEAATKLGKRVIHALGIPSRAAPETSGKYIAQAIMNIFHERGSTDVF